MRGRLCGCREEKKEILRSWRSKGKRQRPKCICWFNQKKKQLVIPSQALFIPQLIKKGFQSRQNMSSKNPKINIILCFYGQKNNNDISEIKYFVGIHANICDMISCVGVAHVEYDRT